MWIAIIYKIHNDIKENEMYKRVLEYDPDNSKIIFR